MILGLLILIPIVIILFRGAVFVGAHPFLALGRLFGLFLVIGIILGIWNFHDWLAVTYNNPKPFIWF